MRPAQIFIADIASKRLAIFYFLVTFSVERGVFVFFLKENGYTLIEIGLLQTAFSASLFAFELPSGYLADRFGRLLALCFGGLLAAISLSGQFLSVSNFSLFLSFFILHALSFSLISGSLSSALYKNLKELDNLRRYPRYYATIQFAGSLSLGLAMISAAPILTMGGWKAVYSASILLATTSVLSLLPLIRTEKLQPFTSEYALQIKTFWNELITVGPIALPFATIHAAMTPYFLYASSSFHDFGLSKGMASAAVGIIEILSALGVLCLTRLFPCLPAWAIPALMALTSIIIAANTLYSPHLAMAAFFAANTLTLWATILANDLINATIASEHLRTTTLSAAAFMDMLFISAGFITYGLIAEPHGLNTSLLAISIFPAAGAAIFYANTKITKSRSQHV
ncbi:MFS transporter [Pseudomonas sp. TE3610]